MEQIDDSPMYSSRNTLEGRSLLRKIRGNTFAFFPGKHRR